MIQQPFRFDFKLVDKKYRPLIHTWLAQPHVATDLPEKKRREMSYNPLKI
jgi:hypothetical protein